MLNIANVDGTVLCYLYLTIIVDDTLTKGKRRKTQEPDKREQTEPRRQSADNKYEHMDIVNFVHTQDYGKQQTNIFTPNITYIT